ncbi:hypothetical protein O4G76_06895 [Limimaricola sp. G21655-S1]|uniref:hypothetical protein n=1 Tax=Limimaricola sp. G21655-S1 TaxID=3014768 RepID=UPI0022AF3F72|nr:hypothetical protein [Limimaricola sp. G21655-S1]MCZ4260567.1 hypothetical protein [Limimaricola sp. G21655-S1]
MIETTGTAHLRRTLSARVRPLWADRPNDVEADAEERFSGATVLSARKVIAPDRASVERRLVIMNHDTPDPKASPRLLVVLPWALAIGGLVMLVFAQAPLILIAAMLLLVRLVWPRSGSN